MRRNLAVMLVSLSACSLQKMAVDQTAGVLAVGSRAFDMETDPILAREAIPGSLKTMETFLEANPEQPILLKLLAEGYMNFAFGFIEDEAEHAQENNPALAEALRVRALNYYLRGRGFALRLLAIDAPEAAISLARGEMPSADALSALGEDELPGMFWTANCWAAAVNVAKTPELIAELPIVRALMERAAAIDPKYSHAGAVMTLGALDAAVPKALGGHPEEGKKQFERAQTLTDGKFFMIDVLFARAIALPMGDRPLYEKLLKDVLAKNVDIDPSVALANRLAQQRALRYLADSPNLFID